jgi:BON domain
MRPAVRITIETSDAVIRNRDGCCNGHTPHQLAAFPANYRRFEMTRLMFRFGIPLTLALAVVSGAAVAQTKESVTDSQLQERVQTALHSDPYFYDAHTRVSIEGGDVVLSGFVFDDWDLRDAVRIATRAAGNRRVVDDLSMVIGGGRT